MKLKKFRLAMLGLLLATASATAAFAEEVTYRYDAAGRLKSMTDTEPVAVARIDFSFDAVGNQVSRVSSMKTDSDNDGMPDEWEVQNGLDPLNPADAQLDADADGLVNLDEFLNGTNPHNPDTDNDGFGDGLEVADGFDPNDPASHP
ncbi:MAG: thrombospondin type 3 repeat-containing protein [Desulfobulbaceae bacterium]|nr:thrombospondin type 3 repeat-containing protein [Desulfobulbaceae bacterium]